MDAETFIRHVKQEADYFDRSAYFQPDVPPRVIHQPTREKCIVRILDGLVDQMMGMKPGESVTISIPTREEARSLWPAFFAVTIRTGKWKPRAPRRGKKGGRR